MPFKPFWTCITLPCWIVLPLRHSRMTRLPIVHTLAALTHFPLRDVTLSLCVLKNRKFPLISALNVVYRNRSLSKPVPRHTFIYYSEQNEFLARADLPDEHVGAKNSIWAPWSGRWPLIFLCCVVECGRARALVDCKYTWINWNYFSILLLIVIHPSFIQLFVYFDRSALPGYPELFDDFF